MVIAVSRAASHGFRTRNQRFWQAVLGILSFALLLLFSAPQLGLLGLEEAADRNDPLART
jgi:hypothetical protein